MLRLSYEYAGRDGYLFRLFSSGVAFLHAQSIDLPTSKQLIGEIPGHPQRLNSLPISMAVSPDKRYVVTVNAGYGTFESQYEQSLAVLDTQTGTVTDFPDARTLAQQRQTDALFRPGLQPRRNPSLRQHGLDHRSHRRRQRRHRKRHHRLQLHGRQNRARAVHPAAPSATRSRPQDAPDRRVRMATRAFRFPAAIAVVGAARLRKTAGRRQSLRRCSAGRSSQRCQIVQRFDLSESDAVPGTYPDRAGRRTRRPACLCRAVECVGDRRTRSRQGNDRAQTDTAQALQRRRAGHAPVRVRVFARRQDSLRRARQSRCRCRGQHRARASSP